jgi:hypothetical protein
MAVALAVTLEEQRLNARLELTGIPVGADTFTIERESPSGNVTGVRGAVDATVTGTIQIVRDYELPFDLTVVYTATVYDAAVAVGSASASFSISYGECQAWLTDLARPTNSLKVTLESVAEKTSEVPSGVHRVLDRRAPVVTAQPAFSPSMDVIFLTDTQDERDAARYLLGTGFPFLIRTTPEQGIGNAYVSPLSFVEERFLTLGAQPERRFRASCVTVERPDPSVYTPVPPATYADVKADYATYADMSAAVANYDDLAYTYPSGVAPPVPPWLPDDI